jgi:hypothetical protein
MNLEAGMSATAPAQGPDREASAGTTSGELACGQHHQLESDWSPSIAFARLLLGLALEGGDQLTAHLRRWDSAAHTPVAALERPPSFRDLQRYATLAMLTGTAARGGMVLRSLLDASDEAATRVGDGFDYALRRWPFRSLRPYLFSLRWDVEEAMDEWIDLGRRKEEQARRMARHAAASLVDEVFDYLAQSPDVRDLVERQAAGAAETAVEDVRERTASADRLVARLVRNLLRRPAGATRAEGHDAATAGKSEHGGAAR